MDSSSTSKSPSPSSESSPYFDSLLRRRQDKKMSITQTYYLAHTARKKLTREASRADHDLRLLVGHANLLDSLMYDLADAEREQERWFNQTVSGATKASAPAPSSRQHVQWASTVVEEPEEDWDPEDASDVDSELSDDSDYDESEFIINTPPRRRAPSPVAHFEDLLEEDDDDDDTDSDFEYDEADDLDELSLTRSSSRQSPPELLVDLDGDSEDEATPPSPLQPTLESFHEKEPTTTAITLANSDQPHLFEQGGILVHKSRPSSRLID
ncbi:uncharacterized protein N7518_007614 [Penicillium psychrosexuale]|uniref:uncharacterized protein n=1 Tax=Penicillium psychrosexuale TaxID=1002107 RepID=UPI0025458BDD|nr:uncharacterized protein N7518_007614 [Penicillium psychrosexuale]KAJ5790603.1 hypothetical protein N7518_007614 [Penicillium psychrosexuale]